MVVSRFSRFRLTFSDEKDNLNLLIPAPTKAGISCTDLQVPANAYTRKSVPEKPNKKNL